MMIQCPPCRWPSVLEGRGPSEDPSILLTGSAHIGNVEVQIVAIRIPETTRQKPDFKREIGEDTYAVNGLGRFLEETIDDLEGVALDLVELLDGRESSAVELATGHYWMWVMPVSLAS